MKTPTLNTDRLVLRPVRLEDAPAIQHHFGRWSIIRHLAVQVPWPYPDDGARTFLQERLLPAVERGETHAWAITRRGDDELIGLLEWRINDADDADNRGFWLSEEHQGEGLMTEAVTGFQDWLFTHTPTQRIFVCNAVVNARSRRIKEKTGAVYVGRSTLLHHEGHSATERWVVTREAWLAHRGLSQE